MHVWRRKSYSPELGGLYGTFQRRNRWCTLKLHLAVKFPGLPMALFFLISLDSREDFLEVYVSYRAPLALSPDGNLWHMMDTNNQIPEQIKCWRFSDCTKHLMTFFHNSSPAFQIVSDSVRNVIYLPPLNPCPVPWWLRYHGRRHWFRIRIW